MKQRKLIQICSELKDGHGSTVLAFINNTKSTCRLVKGPSVPKTIVSTEICPILNIYGIDALFQILMAANSMVGLFWRHAILQDVSQEAWEFIAVCGQIVTIGAPIGSLLGTHFHRQARLFYLKGK